LLFSGVGFDAKQRQIPFEQERVVFAIFRAGIRDKEASFGIEIEIENVPEVSSHNPTLKGWMIASLDILTDFHAGPAGSHVVLPISSVYCQYPRKL
jgi:hypothetical protein